MTDTTFEAFGFSEPLSRALTQCAYTTPTPIQVQALPPQIENRDLLALAETGSGKTAAFVLPVLHRLATAQIQPNPREVVTLILAPTRELAIQIDAEVASLARHMNIRRAVVLGGVGKGPQIHALKRGVHVLVATPGRLLDLVAERHADLRSVRTLVLDEADRMFDMGFIRDIRKIVALLPRQRRTSLFSATMPPEIRALANELLTDPVRVDLSPKQVVVDRIDQKVMIVRANEKQGRLHTILKDDACSRVIVFTRTKRGADRVTSRLTMAGIGAAAIHGNKAQNARQRALSDFSAGHVRVLVATDIAARGIDVSDISHVINFDMPMEAETYVHRIGRTARKGQNGIAISLCDPSERSEIRAIERLMKQTIPVMEDVGGDGTTLSPERPHHTPAGRHARPENGRSNGRGSDRNNKSRTPSRNGEAQQSGARRQATANGEARPQKHADRNAQHDRRPDKNKKPAPQRHAGNDGDSKRHPEAIAVRDKRGQSWDGQAPPKFLKQRGSARSFARPS